MGKPFTSKLLQAFEQTFSGREYRHRSSVQGDYIAIQLYEDLYSLGKSAKLRDRVTSNDRVVNVRNTLRGIRARRGDGTFGERIPGTPSVHEPGFAVARGQLATVELGVEVKILAKAMIKQIDRVGSDLRGQVEHFRRGGGNPITIGIVGVNQAPQYTSYEGDRAFPTDGRRYTHPFQEAPRAIARLQQTAAPAYDHFLILPFKATNVPPFPFDWVDPNGVLADYAAMLTRVSREYDLRF